MSNGEICRLDNNALLVFCLGCYSVLTSVFALTSVSLALQHCESEQQWKV